MQSLPLLAVVAYILWLFFQDARRREGFSPGLWLVCIWVVIISSRSVSTWFDSGLTAGGEAEAYDEGNPIERNVHLFLLIGGVVTLARRGLSLGEVLQQNKWLGIYLLYWLISVIWSDLPFVAFKRWVKDSANVVMVLIILTDRDPVDAAKAVFLRCAFVLVPLSLLFIRYYPELGRAYHPWSGAMMYTGVATHKNTLGVLAMIFGLVLFWDLLTRWRGAARKLDTAFFLRDLPMLGMSIWILKDAHSATSIFCAFIGGGIILGYQFRTIRSRMVNLGVYAVGGALLFWSLDSMLHLRKWMVEDVLGRDMTLTTRTDVWPVLLEHADNPVVGSGFMSFWTGKRLSELYEQYGIIQAHNGYLDLYLNGGLISVLLLAILLFTAYLANRRRLLRGDEFEIMRLTFLVIAVIHNFAEASISKNSLVWFALLLAITRISPAGEEEALASEARSEPPDTGFEEPYPAMR